jgi:hypothetical protein
MVYGRARLLLARVVFVLIKIAVACSASDRVVSRLGRVFALLLRPLTDR